MCVDVCVCTCVRARIYVPMSMRDPVEQKWAFYPLDLELQTRQLRAAMQVLGIEPDLLLEQL